MTPLVVRGCFTTRHLTVDVPAAWLGPWSAEVVVVTRELRMLELCCRLTGTEASGLDDLERGAFLALLRVPVPAATPYPVLLDGRRHRGTPRLAVAGALARRCPPPRSLGDRRPAASPVLVGDVSGRQCEVADWAQTAVLGPVTPAR